MFIGITVLSILGITAFVWLANRALPFRMCPICAGVSGTWLWIIIGIYSGWLTAESWRLIAALAMGGSVVGIAYQLEKKLGSDKSPLLWKTLFIPAGFIAAYGILAQQWSIFFIPIIFLLLIAFIFLFPRKKSKAANKTTEELEEKMKNCC